jgi:hypothetical protein
MMAGIARSLGWMALVVASGLAVGCSSESIGNGSDDVTSGLAFTAKAEPLSSFSYDTGLIPKGSPAQVSLALSAGGGVTVSAVGVPSEGGVAGKAGGGKLALDLHVKMDGQLKIDSTFKKVDTDLPGLGDIDIPIEGEVSFDPFLLAEGDSAELDAAIPETELPEIPLGSVPGKLRITIAEGSAIHASFRGTCLAVSGEKAAYAGELTTSGSLLLKGTLVLDLPAPLNKEIDLGEIKVPVPAVKSALDLGERPAAGIADSSNGTACGAAGSESGAGGSGGTGTGGASAGEGASAGFSMTYAGKPATPLRSIIGEDFYGTPTLYLYFSTSKLEQAAVAISARRKGTGCQSGGAGEVFFVPEVDVDQQEYFRAPRQETCGLVLTSASKEHIAGAFSGHVQLDGRIRNIDVTFDVKGEPASER